MDDQEQVDDQENSAMTELAVKPADEPDDALRRIQRYIAQYDGLELVGSGGMGVVFKGRHLKRQQVEALKVIASKYAHSQKVRRRFLREAEIMTVLQHHNIITIYDYGELADECYLAMEFINGPDLEAFRSKTRPTSLNNVLRFTQGIADALDYAHQQGVIHRDIKPSNVMLRPDPDNPGMYESVLTDFGIVKILGDDANLTTTGSSMGTWWYMAPEQIDDAKYVDHHTDIYALGVLVYELLTTHLPFPNRSVPDFIRACLRNDPIDPRNYVPDLPPQVVEVLSIALDKTPENRFDRASTFVAALREAVRSH